MRHYRHPHQRHLRQQLEGRPAAGAAPPVNLEDADKAADLEAARKITSLRAKRTAVEDQRKAFKDDAEVCAAVEKLVASLTKEIDELFAKRQQALPLHQIGVIVGQKQLELSGAQQRFTKVEEDSTAEIKSFED